MPVPPQDESKPGNGLPNPDLNPMLNPTLGNNLGLWAQVYFTSPPEKREEAVQQLLRDLEKGVKPEQVQSSTSQSEAPVNPAKAAEPTQAAAASEGILCPACLHRNDVKQRFCGLCGFTLRTKDPAETIGTQSIAPSPPASRIETIDRNPNDWQWLHDKNLAELQNRQQRGTHWKVRLAGAGILVLAVAGYVFWSTRGPAPSSVRSTPAGSQNSAIPAANTETRTIEKQSLTRTEVKDAPTPPTPAPTPPTPAPTQLSEAGPPSQVAQGPNQEAPREPVHSPSAEEGAKELEMARRYLDGTAAPKDSQAGAFWLWKAVKKNNEEAVLLLSELYVKGEGVPQSCDQARVLLSAAAKRGFSAAGDKLKQINSSDCR